MHEFQQLIESTGFDLSVRCQLVDEIKKKPGKLGVSRVRGESGLTR
ncbi:MAG: hypothetical protein P0120_14080 [Nitrospira sp.]|nr:hypothetical protein [Nitrospira sp.]